MWLPVAWLRSRPRWQLPTSSALKGLGMRGLGIINAAPVRHTGRQCLSVEAAPELGFRQGRLRMGTPESAVLTTAAILFGVGTVTPFIVAAMLNQPIASIADGAGPEITASITAAPLPEQGETIVRKVAMVPAELEPEMHNDAVPSAGAGPGPMPATHTESSTDRQPALAAPAGTTEDTVEPDNVTEVYRTEPRRLAPVSDPDIHRQPEPTESAAAEMHPEPSELAAGETQPELADPVPIPMQKPKELAPSQSSASTRSARVRTDVRMRAGPRNSASIVTVVRGGSEVQLIGCNYWCQVNFDGKRGWIYRKFIQGAGS